MEGISEAAAVSLPLTNSIRRDIRQQRHQNKLPNPPNRAEIPVLPQMYQLTSTGDQFPQYDSGIGDDGRILNLCPTKAWSYYQICSIGSAMVHLKYAQKSFTRYTQSTH